MKCGRSLKTIHHLLKIEYPAFCIREMSKYPPCWIYNYSSFIDLSLPSYREFIAFPIIKGSFLLYLKFSSLWQIIFYFSTKLHLGSIFKRILFERKSCLNWNIYFEVSIEKRKIQSNIKMNRTFMIFNVILWFNF